MIWPPQRPENKNVITNLSEMRWPRRHILCALELKAQTFASVLKEERFAGFTLQKPRKSGTTEVKIH